MIALDKITKYVAASFTVKEIDLHVPKGATLALFGPSGCGKTTMLRMIAGFDRPDAGSIRIVGKIVSSASQMLAPHQRGVGMVFQDLALWPHMTVHRHLSFVLEGRVTIKHRKAKRIDRMLQRVALANKAGAYPHQLSGGEKQRLAMARALIVKPQVLLMDEPLSNLDTHLRSVMLREIRGLINELKMTTVYVTHDWHEAIYLADHIALMQNGQIARIVKTDDHKAVEAHAATLNFIENKTADGKL